MRGLHHVNKLALAVLVLLLTSLSAGQTLPRGNDSQIWDLAELLSPVETDLVRDDIEQFQKDHDSRIWVILVEDLARYGTTIYEFSDFSEKMLEERLPAYGANESSIVILVTAGENALDVRSGKNWEELWEGPLLDDLRGHAAPLIEKERYSTALRETVLTLHQKASEQEHRSPLSKLAKNGFEFIDQWALLPLYWTIAALLLSLAIFAKGLTSKGIDGTRDPFALKKVSLALSLTVLIGGGVYRFLSDLVDWQIVGFILMFPAIIIIAVRFGDSSDSGPPDNISSMDI